MSFLEEFDGTANYEEAAKSCNSKLGASITLDEYLATGLQLCTLGLLQSNTIHEKRPHRQPIHFHLQLLPPSVIARIAPRLHFFFRPYLFGPLFVLSFLTVGVFVYTQRESIIATSNRTLLAQCVSFFLILSFQIFHELGHAAASSYYGRPSRGIGFGFYYYFMPVFYSNQTRIWLLPPRQRIVVNLSGIYFDFITMLCSIGLWHISHAEFFRFYPYVLLGTTLKNLNIFLRYDGYWVLADALHSDGLNKEANAALRALLSREGRRRPWGWRRVVTTTYGALSRAYGLIFLAILLTAYARPIAEYPLFLAREVSSIGSPNFWPLMASRTAAEHLFPLIFYVIASQKLYFLAARTIRTHKRTAH